MLLVQPVFGAERKFDFSETRENETPKGFRSAAAGDSKPGEWKVILDDVPPMLAPLSPEARVVSKRSVLAQLSRDQTDEHFPLLIYEDETFGDFTLTTRFKIFRGEKEQMAGIAFRLQDEKNFYVLRASSLGNNFRFYKMVNGERGPLFGPEVQVSSGVWHELSVECKGTQIRCFLDGNQAIPTLTDSSFTAGKIAFWTKSDSVSYFCDTRIVYTPREPLAQVLVREAVKNYPRLLGLKIYVPSADPKAPRLIASKDASEVGKSGAKIEEDVIKNGTIYYGKEKGTALVTMPLRDRNGEPIAAARLIMNSLPGQTEASALARAQPIVKQMQARITSLQDLIE
jgi:hypothetical protein